MSRIIAVIGKNFGDEGKGLATDYFAQRAISSGGSGIVIKHNGGAQAGHTVERDGKRFVFHQLSSGSFCGLPTYLAPTFMPDLLKIEDELDSFSELSGIAPALYADGRCRLTTVFDVILNSYAESVRGGDRHGSCGMGINESVVRNEDPEFALTLKEFRELSPRGAALFLEKIRTWYVPKRLDALGLKLQSSNEWCEMMCCPDVSFNAADIMKRAALRFNMTENGGGLLKQYDTLIFEGAQGLMLDKGNMSFYPHLTPSDTGSKNPFDIIRAAGIPYSADSAEVCYVTRSYVTRHGAGRLPFECAADEISSSIIDKTNVFNEWQMSLRFAKHPCPAEFAEYMSRDKEHCRGAETSVFITHLNETGGKISTADGNAEVFNYLSQAAAYCNIDKVYLSSSPISAHTLESPLNI